MKNIYLWEMTEGNYKAAFSSKIKAERFAELNQNASISWLANTARLRDESTGLTIGWITKMKVH